VTGYGLDSVGTVAACGRDIMATLLDAADDHEIIFRPHPHSLRTEAVARIVEEFRAHPRFTLDDDASSYAGTYGRARLMVSDISGTAFTYALATLRPVVFCSFNDDELEARYGSLRYVRDRERVGYIVHNTAQLAETIRGFVTGDIPAPRDIARYRNESLFNVGGAHEYFVRHCGDFMAGTTAADWIEAIS
jgi:hypothetical protein